jgi:hypothetical protein
MIALLCFFLTLFASPFKSKSRLEAENAALRHQLRLGTCESTALRKRMNSWWRWLFLLRRLKRLLSGTRSRPDVMDEMNGEVINSAQTPTSRASRVG